MAIIATKLNNSDGNLKTVRASLFADAKSDVIQGAKIIGLSSDYELEMGSNVVTADGYLGLLKSDGTWAWSSSSGGGGGGGEGTTDYNALSNKPSINGVELVGNIEPQDLHIGVSYEVDVDEGNLIII